MTCKNKVSEHKRICSELREIYEKKNSDYGDSFSRTYKRLGDISVLVRMTDKMDRLTNLVSVDRNVNYESLEDNLLDIANYAIMWLMELSDEVEDFDENNK